MQILARRDEIEVAKLIGAPDSFIRRPFMYHAMWQGLLAGLAAWGLTSWLVMTANPAIHEFAQLYNEAVSLRGLNLGGTGWWYWPFLPCWPCWVPGWHPTTTCARYNLVNNPFLSSAAGFRLR
jgi:cell division protein FtsX